MESLKGKDFLKLLDFSSEEIRYFIDLAAQLKADKKEGKEKQHLVGKRRVYFAPDNSLSNIAVEYLLDGDISFYEKYEVYRLSSTKELCRNYSEKTSKKTIARGIL